MYSPVFLSWPTTSPAILNDEEFETLLNRARTQRGFDVLSWLVLGGLVGLRPYEVLRLGEDQEDT
jgi:hypothetical protein